MLDITLNGAEPTHVDRLSPQFSVDANGKITWIPGLLDYDASLFYRGKTVTNEEFNTLFLRNVYQGNYITDSLSELFDKHLDTAIYRSFTSDFNLVPSYVKTFSASDWGALQDDGYYYLTITAEEHGFNIDEDASEINRMNIDTEMYVLGSDGRFYEVTQVDTDPDNTVRLYTDDNTITGFVVIRTNDKAYALAAATIDATQIVGLAPVATSAKYADLIDRTTPTGPDTRISANAAALASIISDTEVDDDLPFVRKADYATNAENAEYATNLLGSGTIQNQPISTIFEEASSYVKNATAAVHAKYADLNFTKGTIDDRLTTHTTEITQINEDISLLDARLTNLGFKQGSFIVENQSTSSVDDYGEPYATVLLNISVNEIKRQGNYCIANLKVDFVKKVNPNYTGGASSVTYSAKVTVPEEFRPKQTVIGYFAGTTEEVATGYVPNYVNIYADGRVTFKYWSYWSGQFVEGDATYSIGSYITNLGWEAVPII